MFELMRRLWRLVFAAVLLLLPCLALADPADDIVGDWLVKSSDAVIRIQRHGELYDGSIVWQLHDRYGPQEGPELNGKPTMDRSNPDPALRSRTVDGLRLIWDLHYDPEQREWNGGHVYDLNNGHTFSCLMQLIDPNHLKLRGYFGISLLGESSTWTRVIKIPP